MIKKMIWILLTVFLLFMIVQVAMFFLVDSDEKQEGVLIIAHRGGALYRPENTLAAVKNTQQLKVDMVEVDVRMSKDRELVLIHDATVDRTTNGKGKVSDLSLAELKSLEIKTMITSDSASTKIPTLQEILEQPLQGSLILEIKDPSLYENIGIELADIIRKNNAIDKVIVMSFDQKFIQNFKKNNPKVKVGTFHVLPFFIEADYRMDYVGIYWLNHIFFNKRIQAIRKKGVEILTWTVNDEKMKNRIIEKGVDGIITDCP